MSNFGHLVVSCLDVGDAEVPRGVDLPGEGALVPLLRELALLRVGRHLLENRCKAEKYNFIFNRSLQIFWRLIKPLKCHGKSNT